MKTMKVTKKLFAMILAFVTVMALSVTAFAAEGSLTGGSITISNTVAGETYTIYQIAYLESYDVENGAYAYKANAVWADFLNSSEYVTVDDSGYVTWNLDDNETEANADDVRKFVTDALAYAQENNIDNDDSTAATGESVVFENLNLGWYLVDSSLGALCSLDTTNSNMTVADKNEEPSISKAVREDSTNSYGESATIDVIDTINYQLTVTVGAGVDGDYTITDVLPEGISYIPDSVTITGWDSGYTVLWSEDNNTLTIVLDDEALATVNSVTITYNAKVTGTIEAGAEKTNNVTLSYKSQTYTDSADVVTYEIDGSAEGNTFTKVDGSDNTPLAGVKFVLSKNGGEGTGTLYATFNQAGWLTDWTNDVNSATELTTDSAGHIYAYGLDADTYVLTETETLPGYNLLADTITVIIAENGTVSYKYTSTEGVGSSTITIENNSGSLLPSTGGMGTTIFYIVGAVLVIGAGIVLVVRRRMSANQ